MSALTDTHPTLLDVMKRMDQNGKIAPVIEVLDQQNEILDDIVWLEANSILGHRTTMRSGIPEPTFRKLYKGVQPSKSRTVQVTEQFGMMENYSQIDKALADLNGNTREWRFSEELPFIEGFGQKLTRSIFYENEDTTPEAFTGLTPRYSSVGAANGENIIKDSSVTGGQSDNTSIWICVWGPNTGHMIYPQGSQAGLKIEDKGQQTITESDGSMWEAYRTHYRQDAGLVIRDWRYFTRIQFATAGLTKNAATGPDLFDLLAQGLDMIPNINAGRAAIYCNRTVRGWFRRQLMNKTSNSTLSVEQITRTNGNRVHMLMFDGIPIRRVDQLINTEAEVGA